MATPSADALAWVRSAPTTEWIETPGDGTGRYFSSPLGLTATELRGPALTAVDRQRICDLVNQDRIPGHPLVTPAQLDEAIAGRSAVDSVFWNEIQRLSHVQVFRGRELAAAGAYGIKGDGTGTIPWLHAGEDPQATVAALDLMLRSIGSLRYLDAFNYATPLHLGLEGLPKQHRPVTDEALRSRGCRGEDLWLYMVAKAQPGSIEGPAQIKPLSEQELVPGQTPRAWHLTVPGAGDKPKAEAKIEVDDRGVGVLWWIEVSPEARGQGLGRELLRQASAQLAANGAKQIVLYVDHDDPAERPRSAAISLYESEGFEAVDHLWSYERGEGGDANG